MTVDPKKAFLVPGRTAVVTGAGSGIGEETAAVLAAAGARVVCADLNEAQAQRVAKRITDDGGEAIGVRVDVTDHDDVTRVVAEAISRFGSLDIMCNVAGILIMNELVDVSPEEFDRVLSVNLKGVLYGSQAAARVMNDGGRIINIASTIIDKPSVGRGSYAASKGGVEQLNRTLALELGPRGIRVNGIAPGWVETGLTSQHFTTATGEVDEAKRAEYIASKMGGSPLGTVTSPQDVPLGVLYLASEAGSFITGQMLRINGGMTMA